MVTAEVNEGPHINTHDHQSSECPDHRMARPRNYGTQLLTHTHSHTHSHTRSTYWRRVTISMMTNKMLSQLVYIN